MKMTLRKSIKLLLGGSLAVMFVGCTTNGPQFNTVAKPKKDAALVYVYRPSTFVGSGVYYNVHVTDKTNADKVIGELVSGSYFTYESEAGETEIWAKTEAKSSVTLDLEVGKMYCVKGEVGIGLIVGRPHLSIVDNKICMEDLKETKLNIYNPEKK